MSNLLDKRSALLIRGKDYDNHGYREYTVRRHAAHVRGISRGYTNWEIEEQHPAGHPA